MICITCNKEHNGTFGAGKYCCRSCSNSRVRPDAVKQQISATIKSKIQSGEIKTERIKGIKKKIPRSAEHTAKIASQNKLAWDIKGRRTPEQKKAGVKAAVYAYRARKRNAIPADADLSLIRQIYLNTPTGYEVDHIIALANGGLHHQDNLQYLPLKENRRKGTKNIYDMSLILRWQDLLHPCSV
jgi:5-methylcytosine-specific restriction endonuclease McrA